MEKQGLIEVALSDPKDKLTAYAVADMYEELGVIDVAFAWRWMGWHDRRPGFREGPRITNPWVWYLDATWTSYTETEKVRFDKLEHARLGYFVFGLLSRTGYSITYQSCNGAVLHLAQNLQRLIDVVSKPVGID